MDPPPADLMRCLRLAFGAESFQKPGALACMASALEVVERGKVEDYDHHAAAVRQCLQTQDFSMVMSLLRLIGHRWNGKERRCQSDTVSPDENESAKMLDPLIERFRRLLEEVRSGLQSLVTENSVTGKLSLEVM